MSLSAKKYSIAESHTSPHVRRKMRSDDDDDTRVAFFVFFQLPGCVPHAPLLFPIIFPHLQL